MSAVFIANIIKNEKKCYKTNYLASKANATIPDANGAAADVPV